MLLGEMLVVRGLATPSQIAAALEHQAAQGGRLGAILIGMGVLTSTQLLQFLREQKEVRVTLPFCQQTLERWEEQLGAAHPSTTRVRYNLARVLLVDGRPEEALALSEKAHEMSCLIYGPAHPSTEEAAKVKEACELAVNHHGTRALARLRELEMPHAGG